MRTRTLLVLSALALSAWATADQMYSGTWEVSGQAAGTVTLRVRDDGTVTGALLGNSGSKVKGHLRGTYEGKRFKLTMRLRDKGGQEFQGNFTHNDAEAHMDGLLYVADKPVDDIRLTVNAMPVTMPAR
ncbi:MAG: hypothetical protein JSS66_17495 [Armatimonadetes bacterium]|nr:hypothetical protein [Armatimonadota bacterium]